LAPLLDLDLSSSSFEPEHGQVDGTTAHAIERLIFYAGERAGYKSLHVGVSEDAEPFETLIAPNELEQGWINTR
jgi:lipopolysaccharide biosynthesis protein